MAEEDAKARPLRFAWYGRLSTESSSSPTLHSPRSERLAIAASMGLGESSANSATFSRGDRPIERVSRAF